MQPCRRSARTAARQQSVDKDSGAPPEATPKKKASAGKRRGPTACKASRMKSAADLHGNSTGQGATVESLANGDGNAAAETGGSARAVAVRGGQPQSAPGLAPGMIRSTGTPRPATASTPALQAARAAALRQALAARAAVEAHVERPAVGAGVTPPSAATPVAPQPPRAAMPTVAPASHPAAGPAPRSQTAPPSAGADAAPGQAQPATASSTSAAEAAVRKEAAYVLQRAGLDADDVSRALDATAERFAAAAGNAAGAEAEDGASDTALECA